MDQLSARTLSLIITHKCNLDCIYCYEKHKSNVSMPLKVAKEIIDGEFRTVTNSKKFNYLHIEFMGGEPFLEFKLMKEILEWNNKLIRQVPYGYFATTNGTLLTDDVMEWLHKHSEQFKIGMSFDGTPEMQNINRNNTSERVALNFFKRTYPDQYIKMTISPFTVQYMADGVIYLHENGFRFTANCAHGMTWKTNEIEEYQRQLLKLADYYIEHLEYQPIAALDLGMRRLLLKDLKPEAGCGIGDSMISYDVEGDCYACPVLSPMVLGDNRAQVLNDSIFSNRANYHDYRCDMCILKHICRSTCHAFNYILNGDIAIREDSMCELSKINYCVYCQFKTQQLMRKKDRNIVLSDNDIQEAAGILRAHELGFPNTIGMH